MSHPFVPKDYLTSGSNSLAPNDHAAQDCQARPSSSDPNASKGGQSTRWSVPLAPMDDASVASWQGDDVRELMRSIRALVDPLHAHHMEKNTDNEPEKAYLSKPSLPSTPLMPLKEPVGGSHGFIGERQTEPIFLSSTASEIPTIETQPPVQACHADQNNTHTPNKDVPHPVLGLTSLHPVTLRREWEVIDLHRPVQEVNPTPQDNMPPQKSLSPGATHPSQNQGASYVQAPQAPSALAIPPLVSLQNHDPSKNTRVPGFVSHVTQAALQELHTLQQNDMVHDDPRQEPGGHAAFVGEPHRHTSHPPQQWPFTHATQTEGDSMTRSPIVSGGSVLNPFLPSHDSQTRSGPLTHDVPPTHTQTLLSRPIPQNDPMNPTVNAVDDMATRLTSPMAATSPTTPAEPLHEAIRSHHETPPPSLAADTTKNHNMHTDSLNEHARSGPDSGIHAPDPTTQAMRSFIQAVQEAVHHHTPLPQQSSVPQNDAYQTMQTPAIQDFLANLVHMAVQRWTENHQDFLAQCAQKTFDGMLAAQADQAIQEWIKNHLSLLVQTRIDTYLHAIYHQACQSASMMSRQPL